jgi:hypothetical protein
MRAIVKSLCPCFPTASREIHCKSIGASEKARLPAMQKQENLPEEGVNEK